jgi:DNA-binding XRE family transcriptional regulator
LPFSKICETLERQTLKTYPKILKTIGDHIRAWRIKKDLLQTDIAKLLGVCEDSIVGWEIRGTAPSIRLMPPIIKMLGYLPLEIDVSTLGGRIVYFRYMHGMTAKRFGCLVGADPTTVRAWEANNNVPHCKRKEFIERIISNTVTKGNSASI